MMKRILIDTDLGIDCDDAIALAMLINLEKRKECEIASVTISSSRKGAAAAARAMFDWYGAACPPIGKYLGPPLPADAKNIYASALAEKYKKSDRAEAAVAVLRRALAETRGRCTLAAIGPLCNLEALLSFDSRRRQSAFGCGTRTGKSRRNIRYGRLLQRYA